MKTLTLLLLSTFVFFLACCKATQPTDSNNAAPRSLSDLANVLKSTQAKYNALYSLTNHNSRIAIEQTKDWLLTQPNVASAESLDSNYIDITLASGLETTFYIDELTADGHSRYRGGGGSHGVRLEVTGKPATHLIKNKDVLIYAPGYSQFYTPAQMQRIVNMLNTSGKVSVTLQVDDKCGFKMVESFKDYGWVIMDTHGEPDAFWTGTVVDTAVGNDEALLKTNIIAAAGTEGYDRVQTKELRLVAVSQKKVVVINGEPELVDFAATSFGQRRSSSPLFQVCLPRLFTETCVTAALAHLCRMGRSQCELPG